MPFGLHYDPSIYSYLVCKLVVVYESFCLVYLDDVSVFSETWSDRVRHLRIVFERVRNTGLTLKRSKCKFAATVFEYHELT